MKEVESKVASEAFEEHHMSFCMPTLGSNMLFDLKNKNVFFIDDPAECNKVEKVTHSPRRIS